MASSLIVLAAEPGLDERQAHQEQRVVIGRNPVMTLDATAQAAMHHYLFPVWAEEGARRSHERLACAAAVARCFLIDMQRVQAAWAVVALPSAGKRQSNKRLTLPALERFADVHSAALTLPFLAASCSPVVIDSPARLTLWPFKLFFTVVIVVRRVA